MNDRSAQMVLIWAGPVELGMAKALLEKKLQKNSRHTTPHRRSFRQSQPRIQESRFSSVIPEYRGSRSDWGGVRHRPRALAQQLAAAGSALGLADIDEAGLLQTAQSLEKKGALVTTHVADVAKEEVVRSFAEDVGKKHGRVTLLINNAGVALEGTFEEISLDDFRWLMNINFWGTVYGVKHFLPILKREERSHIVNLSSVFGLIAPPGQPLIPPASLRCA